MPARTHKDVEFHVEPLAGKTRTYETKVFSSWDEAAGLAVMLAASGHRAVHIDVVIWSRAGAEFYGGEDAAQAYDEDPEASVFQRIEVKANDWGRVP